MILRQSFKLSLKRKALSSNRQAIVRTLSSASPMRITTSKDSSPNNSRDPSETKPREPSSKSATKPSNAKNVKSVAQADAELRERLERMSGEGGAAGIEYEDGKPSAMKRGVRNNMFRLI